MYKRNPRGDKERRNPRRNCRTDPTYMCFNITSPYIKLLIIKLRRNHKAMKEKVEKYSGLNLKESRKVYIDFVNHPFYKTIEKVYSNLLTVSKTGKIKLIHFDDLMNN